jgi:hypothetical protein
MSHFKTFIGIDYSGSGTPLARTAGLQVYIAATNRLPKRVEPPQSPTGRRPRNWNRKEVAEWLIRRAESDVPFIAGLDFSFSLPISYFQRYRLNDWDAFLRDFVQHWPTDRDDATVDQFRHGNARTGTNDELRVTEKWTSSAKSNFQFDIQGQVAKSTHAGIPWLYRIRQIVEKKVHFWPFDGWEIHRGRSVIAEVFPSILRRRYPRENRTVDQHDAYAIARWLKDAGWGRTLDDVYFDPLLTGRDRGIAEREGWILGVT